MTGSKVTNLIYRIDLYWRVALPALAIYAITDKYSSDYIMWVLFIGGLFGYSVYLATITELSGKPTNLYEAILEILLPLLIPLILMVSQGRNLLAFIRYTYMVELLGVLLSVSILSLLIKHIRSITNKFVPHMVTKIKVPDWGSTGPGIGLPLFFMTILIVSSLPFLGEFQRFQTYEMYLFVFSVFISFLRSMYMILFAKRHSDEFTSILIGVFLFLGGVVAYGIKVGV